LVFILRIGETPGARAVKIHGQKSGLTSHESHVAQIENHAQVDETTRYNLVCLKSLANMRLDEIRRRCASAAPAPVSVDFPS
jgi:hypothetical protein